LCQSPGMAEEREREAVFLRELQVQPNTYTAVASSLMPVVFSRVYCIPLAHPPLHT
jgi:hypothetical protein